MRISDWSSDVCSSDLPAPRNCRGGVSFGKKGIGHKGSIDVSGIPALASGEEFLRMWKQSNGNVMCVIDLAALGADPMPFGPGSRCRPARGDRKRVVWGKSVSVSVNHGSSSSDKKKK